VARAKRTARAEARRRYRADHSLADESELLDDEPVAGTAAAGRSPAPGHPAPDGTPRVGIFTAFLRHHRVRLYGVEAGGLGLSSGKHGATLIRGKVGVLHGSKSFLLQDGNGQILEAHSISAGLDYPGVGPEHAWLKATGRAKYVSVTDAQALSGFNLLSRYEGIQPALESSHAVAFAYRLAGTMRRSETVLVNLSGRGDKDMGILMELQEGGRDSD